MYYCYIIQSIKTNKFYIGSTNNLIKRIKEHNEGLSKYTRNKGPWLLKYNEQYQDLKNARQREKQIKSWKKRRLIIRLIDTGPVV